MSPYISWGSELENDNVNFYLIGEGVQTALKCFSYYMNVPLANRMSKRIREKQDGDVSDDETIQFKSYLMSMGISDPVTRETSGGSKQTYFVQLAKEIESALRQPGFCEFLVCVIKNPHHFW